MVDSSSPWMPPALCLRRGGGMHTSVGSHDAGRATGSLRLLWVTHSTRREKSEAQGIEALSTPLGFSRRHDPEIAADVDYLLERAACPTVAGGGLGWRGATASSTAGYARSASASASAVTEDRSTALGTAPAPRAGTRCDVPEGAIRARNKDAGAMRGGNGNTAGGTRPSRRPLRRRRSP